jgi:hypothetical protein
MKRHEDAMPCSLEGFGPVIHGEARQVGSVGLRLSP